jgi:hypothetical protein
MKPFFPCSAELWKRAIAISKTSIRTESLGRTWRQSMRPAGFLLAIVFVIVGSSIAGFAESDIPGIGTFAYTGSPPANFPALVVAAR